MTQRQQAELEISRRETLGKANRRLRKTGVIPGNIFGHQQESQAIQIDAITFERFRREHRAARVISLKMADGGTAETALIRHVQHDPRTGKILHIDFFRVSLDERIAVRVTLHTTGESLAVRNEGGVLLHLMDALEVECRADQIPDGLEIDVSSLNEIDAMLYARDVQLPANVSLVSNPDEPVVKVGATRAEVATEAEEGAGTSSGAAGAPAAAGEGAAAE